MNSAATFLEAGDSPATELFLARGTEEGSLPRAFGRGGGDIVSGGAGRDVISGGRGNDAIYGGRGNDFIDGRTVNGDPANVEQGEDRIHCGADEDDQVVANRFDYVVPDCEHVSRNGQGGG